MLEKRQRNEFLKVLFRGRKKCCGGVGCLCVGGVFFCGLGGGGVVGVGGGKIGRWGIRGLVDGIEGNRMAHRLTSVFPSGCMNKNGPVTSHRGEKKTRRDSPHLLLCSREKETLRRGGHSNRRLVLVR